MLADSIAILLGFLLVNVPEVKFLRVGTLDKLLGVVDILVCERGIPD